MDFWLGVFCGGFAMFVVLGFILALCRVSADADRTVEWMREAGL